MLRALFITNSLTHGGAERHAVSLVNRLSDRGVDCHAAYIKNDGTQVECLVHPGNSYCLDARRYLDSHAIRRLARLVKELRPSVIVAANEYSLLYATLARLLAGTGAPLVVTYHSTLLRKVKERAQMLLYRFLFWHAHCAVFVCDNQRRYWRRRLVFGRRNEVIHNGIDTAAFRPAAAASPVTRASLGLEDSDYVIGVAAGLRPEKNHVQLVEAVRRLREDGRPARALLIGDGPTRPIVEARARDAGIGEHVLITGYQRDVRPYIELCDVMTLCSTTETFSLSAIEAMALGKPFVHSDVGGASEMIFSGWNGFLFPVGDDEALLERLHMLADRERARTMGRNARLLVEHRFSEQHMVDAYEHLLRDVCADGDEDRGSPRKRRPSCHSRGSSIGAHRPGHN